MKRFLLIIQIAVLVMLSGCVSVYEYWAPDTLTKGAETDLDKRYHEVQVGETLHLIAWIYDMNYLDIVAWNEMQEPYEVNAGQQLRIYPLSEISESESERQKTVAQQAEIDQDLTKQPDIAKQDQSVGSVKPVLTGWHWPTEGKLRCRFVQDECINGLNIVGKLGQPVYAAASGEVVYSGEGIRHYRSLILIKHADNYFSAYAHNEDLLVKSGDMVSARQKIASMGIDIWQNPTLFFQIRKDGKPVDPLQFLSRRKA